MTRLPCSGLRAELQVAYGLQAEPGRADQEPERRRAGQGTGISFMNRARPSTNRQTNQT